MNQELAAVAERLAQEYADLPCLTVIEAICECVEGCRGESPFFVEQAVRATLAARCAAAAATVPPVPPDPLDSLPTQRTGEQFG